MSETALPPLLFVENLHAFYDKSHVLRGVDFQLRAGEIVALLGRDGSGRSTMAKALMGLVSTRNSTATITTSVQLGGEEMLGKKPFEIARLGLGYVPETGDVFPKLTVHQNLLLGQQPRSLGYAHAHALKLEDLYTLFPRLRERQHTAAGLLSGGEQQILALCRTLMGAPQVLLADEPTKGLAPQMVQSVIECLQQLKARGASVLWIEHQLDLALRVSDRCLVMGNGVVVFDGSPQALLANDTLRQTWLQA